MGIRPNDEAMPQIGARLAALDEDVPNPSHGISLVFHGGGGFCFEAMKLGVSTPYGMVRLAF